MADIKDLQDARRFIPCWVETKGITISGNGKITGIAVKTAFATLWLDYLGMVRVAKKEAMANSDDGETAPKFKLINEKDLQKAWEEYPSLVQAEALRKLRAALKFEVDRKDLVADWLTAVIGTASELQIAVLRHVMWQVKRKIYDKRVVHHLCPLFFGKQGGGKSTAISKLVEPINPYIIDFSPHEATDPRNVSALNENYICLFDELAGMKFMEMETFKKVITADTLTYRPLYTNMTARCSQNTTFIGTSNKSLSDNINDSSGLRRFYEYRCLDKMEHSVINNIDYVAMWLGIDENLERGYIESVIEELQEHQQQAQIEDEVQQFIKEQEIMPVNEIREITAQQLHQHYSHWRVFNGWTATPAMNIGIFCRKLSTYKLAKRLGRVDGTQKSLYKINADSKIFDPAKLTEPPSLKFKGNA